MMWAPIANNVVSIMVLLLFLIVFGRTSTGAPFTTSRSCCSGWVPRSASPLRPLVLIPFLRASGYRFRPRFDFRHTGLGKTFRLAKWTLGFVLVTQAAFVVVTKLASGATVGGDGAGLTAYSNAYAVWILPHSLITVSLATAMLPAASRLAAAGDRPGVAAETMRAIRLATPHCCRRRSPSWCSGCHLAHLAFGFGQGAKDAVVRRWGIDGLGDRAGAVHRAIHLPARLLRVGGHPNDFLPAVSDRRRQCRPGCGHRCCCSMGRRWWQLGWLSPIRRPT